jgi:hypothetical protein
MRPKRAQLGSTTNLRLGSPFAQPGGPEGELCCPYSRQAAARKPPAPDSTSGDESDREEKPAVKPQRAAVAVEEEVSSLSSSLLGRKDLTTSQ